jgi:hypothetical protein
MRRSAGNLSSSREGRRYIHTIKGPGFRAFFDAFPTAVISTCYLVWYVVVDVKAPFLTGFLRLCETLEGEHSLNRTTAFSAAMGGQYRGLFVPDLCTKGASHDGFSTNLPLTMA